jgi:hypothetical protein
MKTLFWLYKSRLNKKGLIPVMMRITLNSNRINFPTGVEIEESFWDKDRPALDLVKAKRIQHHFYFWICRNILKHNYLMWSIYSGKLWTIPAYFSRTIQYPEVRLLIG